MRVIRVGTVLAVTALSCTSNSATVFEASSPATPSATQAPIPSINQNSVDRVCAAITVATGLLSKALNLSADKIQDAVNTDLGIFQEEIQPHTSQIGDPAAEAALSDLLYDSYNVTDFNGVVGSDEFINRMRTFVKAAQDFNRNYCLLF